MAARQHPTRRQLEVLRAYIAAGSIAGAAQRLDIAESTARQHLSGLYRRTGCLNVAQAAYGLGAGHLTRVTRWSRDANRATRSPGRSPWPRPGRPRSPRPTRRTARRARRPLKARTPVGRHRRCPGDRPPTHSVGGPDRGLGATRVEVRSPRPVPRTRGQVVDPEPAHRRRRRDPCRAPGRRRSRTRSGPGRETASIRPGRCRPCSALWVTVSMSIQDGADDPMSPTGSWYAGP